MVDEATMRRTADELLDYLASDGKGGSWVRFIDLDEWESLYNLHGEKNFLGKLARNLAFRELANARRLSHGMQLRLTNLGVKLARERVQESVDELAAINWSTLFAALPKTVAVATALEELPQALS